MEDSTGELSFNNYQKYKDDIEYDLLIHNKKLIDNPYQFKKMVLDDLYENKLISKEFYTIELDTLQYIFKEELCWKKFYRYLLLSLLIFIFYWFLCPTVVSWFKL